MSTFEVRATVSHRYYMNKSKDEIIRRIYDMKYQLEKLGEDPIIDSHKTRRQLLDNYTKWMLSDLAMAMHDCFPDNA